MRASAIVPLFVLTALTACAPATVVDESRSGPRPENHEAIVRSYIHENFFDPYSVRDLAISEPIHGAMYQRQGWLVCFRANGKNRMGAYTGLKMTALLIYDGKIIDTDDDQNACRFFKWPPL